MDIKVYSDVACVCPHQSGGQRYPQKWKPGSDPGGGGGGGGGAKGAEAPPPLQVNEMRNIHFGQNTNSRLSETSEKDTTA